LFPLASEVESVIQWKVPAAYGLWALAGISPSWHVVGRAVQGAWEGRGGWVLRRVETGKSVGGRDCCGKQKRSSEIQCVNEGATAEQGEMRAEEGSMHS
jgi:hypothetical protein